jgi:hypothetical protein
MFSISKIYHFSKIDKKSLSIYTETGHLLQRDRPYNNTPMLKRMDKGEVPDGYCGFIDCYVYVQSADRLGYEDAE